MSIPQLGLSRCPTESRPQHVYFMVTLGCVSVWGQTDIRVRLSKLCKVVSVSTWSCGKHVLSNIHVCTMETVAGLWVCIYWKQWQSFSASSSLVWPRLTALVVNSQSHFSLSFFLVNFVLNGDFFFSANLGNLYLLIVTAKFRWTAFE